MSIPPTGLQLVSLLKGNGELEVSLLEAAVAEPAEDEVLVRIDAAPLNPSDLGLLFGTADLDTLEASGTGAKPVITAVIPERLMRSMTGRIGQRLPVGNEGAGVVIATGASAAARALLGKTVATLGGSMYSQYRTLRCEQCLPLPEGTQPAEGASCFVNPLTALGMVETLRREGHLALVHTAAASNLGQMLNRICLKDGIELVCIVRQTQQEQLLRAQGARYVCNSSSRSFMEELTAALTATGATLAFDAVGGGKLTSQILTCMEAAATAKMTQYSRYGSSVNKQVYIYGGLDRGPTELARSYGMTWSVGGWLLTPFLQKIGLEARQRLRERVIAELKTTFASHYTRQISLQEALQPEIIAQYAKFSTGEKFLINPNK